MIITIVGPTGVGKTKLSIELAKKYDAEIINADAVQVFKKLNIGTAKVTEEEKCGIKHHLIDFVDPEDNYSVADFQKDGRNVLDKLMNENKNIIIVGGSGLYIKALLYDYDFSNETRKINFNLTNKELKEKVDSIYPNNNIHINNRKRLTRFLENYTTTGKIIKNENKDKKLYDSIIIGLTTNREKLYKIIDNRVDKMFDLGLLEEATNLYNENIKRCSNVIGYQELFNYFDNNISLEEAKELIKRNSRRYAKRQYTWFNNQMNVNWIDVNFEDFDLTIKEAENLIKNLR